MANLFEPKNIVENFSFLANIEYPKCETTKIEEIQKVVVDLFKYIESHIDNV